MSETERFISAATESHGLNEFLMFPAVPPVSAELITSRKLCRHRQKCAADSVETQINIVLEQTRQEAPGASSVLLLGLKD